MLQGLFRAEGNGSVPSLREPESRRQRRAFLLFSLAIACALVLSLHLHIGVICWGNVEQNTFSPFGLWDVGVFLLAAGGSYLLSARLLFPALRRAGLRLRWTGEEPRQELRRFLLLFALLFLCRLPYLLRAYPGFVIEDSYDSLLQAMGKITVTNRNPVLFMLFIRLCLWLGGAFSSGDVTLGCFVFTLLQTLFLSAVFARTICWVMARFGLKSRWWILPMLLYFGVNPYFSAFGVTMLKDPVFSGAVVLLSLRLGDFGLSKGASLRRVGDRVSLAAVALLCAFWRNNGFSALLAALLILLLSGPRGEKRWKRPGLLILSGCFAVWALVFTVGFRLLGIWTPREETAGLMLNQLARAVACEGRLSEADEAFLGELLPMEAYRESYRPCCVDTLKWENRFNYDALAGLRLPKTWLSVGLKNPLRYLEAWALETYGFWSFTHPEALACPVEYYSVAALYDDEGRRDIAGLQISTRFTREKALDPAWLPLNTLSVPAGVLFWVMLFGCAVNAAAGQRELNLLYGPSLGVFLGLILGSPIWYVPRYGACAQMLLPVLLLLPFAHTAGKGPQEADNKEENHAIQ